MKFDLLPREGEFFYTQFSDLRQSAHPHN
jgi:hypothetical protein